jgi:hypothetical protein
VVKGHKILLGIAMLVSAVSALGLVLTDDPRAALSPTLGLIVCGGILYKLVRHPPAPRRWTRQRLIVRTSILGAVSVPVLVCFIWVAVIRPEWPIRLVAVIGILSVPALVLWFVRTARAEDQAARMIVQEPPAE